MLKLEMLIFTNFCQHYLSFLVIFEASRKSLKGSSGYLFRKCSFWQSSEDEFEKRKTLVLNLAKTRFCIFIFRVLFFFAPFFKLLWHFRFSHFEVLGQRSWISNLVFRGSHFYTANLRTTFVRVLRTIFEREICQLWQWDVIFHHRCVT